MILYSKIKIQKKVPEKMGLIIPAEYVPKFCILKILCHCPAVLVDAAPRQPSKMVWLRKALVVCFDTLKFVVLS